MILNRYFLKDIILYTTSVGLIFLLLVVSSRSIQYLEQAALGEVNPAVVGWVIFYRLPEFLQIILPLSFFLSLIITLGKLSADNELGILEQIGFSEKKLIAISFIPASLIASISLILSIWIAPISSNQAELLLKKQSFEDSFNSIQPGKFFKLNNDLLFYMKERTAKGLESVFIKSANSEGSLKNGVILAKRASVAEDKNSLLLEDGSLYLSTNTEEFSKLTFEELEIDMTINPDRDMTSDKVNILKKIANKQWNISLALICIVGVLLAIPIGKVKPRKGRHSKLLPAVLLFIFYLGLLITGRGWVESGSLGEYPGMYLIHLIFIILGLVLLFKKELIKKFK